MEEIKGDTMQKRRFLCLAVVLSVLSVLTGCQKEIKMDQKTLYEKVMEIDDATIEAENADDLYKYSYAKVYEDTKKGKGFTNVDVFNNQSGWGQNHTHFVDSINNNEMNFLWQSPTLLGDFCFYNGRNPVQLILKDFQIRWNKKFIAYYFGEWPSDQSLFISKEEAISLEDEKLPCLPDRYYNVEETGYSIAYTFAIGDKKKKGYAKYLINKESRVCYKFYYVEKIDNYDEERALKVITSINFWNYFPVDNF